MNPVSAPRSIDVEAGDFVHQRAQIHRARRFVQSLPGLGREPKHHGGGLVVFVANLQGKVAQGLGNQGQPVPKVRLACALVLEGQMQDGLVRRHLFEQQHRVSRGVWRDANEAFVETFEQLEIGCLFTQ